MGSRVENLEPECKGSGSNLQREGKVLALGGGGQREMRIWFCGRECGGRLDR